MKLTVDPSQPRSREVVLTGWDNDSLVIVLIPTFQLEDYFRRDDMPLEQARQIAAVNLDTIQRVAGGKYRRGEFHMDTLSGRAAYCVHVGVSDLLEVGDGLFDTAFTEEA